MSLPPPPPSTYIDIVMYMTIWEYTYMQHTEKKDYERDKVLKILNFNRTFLIFRHHRAVANIAERSLCRCQYCGEFIVPLPTEHNNILGLKCSLRQIQICLSHSCQQLYAVNKRQLKEMCALLAICFQIANSRTRWRCNFKGLSQHGGRADFSQNLRASIFNDDLSNEPNFCRIHLGGQYL